MFLHSRKTVKKTGGASASAPKKTKTKKRVPVECAEDDEECARATTDIQGEILFKLF